MLGAAGAAACLALGTALGSWLRERRMLRFQMISAMMDALGGMRLFLEQERPALPELLSLSATCASGNTGGDLTARRLMLVSEALVRDPMLSLSDAYARACAQIPTPWEQADERAVLETLFAQLGSGTAAMREQAVSACLRRLKPIAQSAQTEAENGGKLCMQLGMLLGLMCGILLW